MSSPRSSTYALLAPGAASHAAHAPGVGDRRPPARRDLPAVDDHVVVPESHTELVDGVVYETMGAKEPHATLHLQVARVFAGCLASGYEAAVDMLTRADEDNDAAPDVSVYPRRRDRKTGGRKLEEIAFEVCDTERDAHLTTKVKRLAARGVRRLFYVDVDTRTLHEWRHDPGDWVALGAEAEIVDRCFRVPIPARALVDRVLADDTVARALLAGHNRVIAAAIERERSDARQHGIEVGHKTGLEAGVVVARREVLRMLLGQLPLSDDDQRRIDACVDVATLDRWIRRAPGAASAAEVFAP